MSEQARRALLIATSMYDDPTLANLTGAVRDAAELADVLADPDIGNFDVRTVLDRPAHEVAKAIEEFLQARRHDDLALLYITGHGIKGPDGTFYFAARNTRQTLLLASAIAASWVHTALDACRSRHQIVLLDCCHSGAFARGFKAGARAGSVEQLTGRGRVVLTASDALQFAWERPEDDDMVRSLFTSSVVTGLRTGDADLDGDGRVTVDDLFDYVADAVRRENPHQAPEMSAVALRGDLVIASNPHATTPPVPPEPPPPPPPDDPPPAPPPDPPPRPRQDDPVQRGTGKPVQQWRRAGSMLALLTVTAIIAAIAASVWFSNRGQGQSDGSRTENPAPVPPVIAQPTPTPSPDETPDPDPVPDDPALAFDLDELRWSETTPDDMTDGASVSTAVWHDGRFFAAGAQLMDSDLDAFVVTSSDGRRWERYDPDALDVAGEQSMRQLARGPDGLIAVGSAGERPDQDAAVWLLSGDEVESVEPTAALTDGHRQMLGVAWDEREDQFVAVGCVDDPSDDVCEQTTDGSQRSAVWTSPNGREWEEVPADRIDRGDQTAMHGIAQTADGLLVATGYEQPADDTTRTAALWTSTDGGQHWERVDLPDPDGATGQALLQVVAYDGGLIAGGYAWAQAREAAVWQSADGYDWNAWLVEDPLPNHQVMHGITATGNGFIGVGRHYDGQTGKTRGVVWVSDDGQTWTRQQPEDFPGDNTVLRTVAASEDHVVAGGGGGEEITELRLWTGTRAE